MFEGIFFKAAVLTLAVLFTVLFLHRSGLNMNPKIQTGVLLVTGAVALLYLSSFLPVVSGTSGHSVSRFPQADLALRFAGIGIAALNLLLDISTLKKNRQQKTGWAAGLGLALVLVWLYIEILSLELLYAPAY